MDDEKMEPAYKISKIIDAINSGRTVFFTTHTKTIKVNKKTLDKFTKLGYNLFKADSKSIYMMSGTKYICIDYCKITFSN